MKIAIFASGSGSNAENIIQYFQKKEDVTISMIFSNKADAYVLERAKKLGIKTTIFSSQDLKQNDSVLRLLKELNIDFIVLAGFMLKIPMNILEAYPNKIINIHPSLLPKFGGKGMYGEHVHEAVISCKEEESGITIHYVNEHYDEGQIIFQARCKVDLLTDTASSLAEKVHALEYEFYPKVIEQVIFSR